jgi:hypothetical protein
MTAVRQTNHRSSRQTLTYGSETIDFGLSFSDRKQLTISVEPDGEVFVKAPEVATFESVIDHVRRKAGWIVRQRDQFAAFGPVMPPKRYASGETHGYLGRKYRLRVTKGAVPDVKLVGGFFEIVVLDKSNAAAVRRQLERWYRRQAVRVFADHVEQCLALPALRRLSPPQLVIRRMKRRWGSCTKDGVVLLNPLLVLAPGRCIDYVITHELCHLINHSHNAAFYRSLDRAMPDWRKVKRRLETCVE